MNPFDMPIDCDVCGTQFVMDDSRIASIKEGELEVQYFSCPACGARYHVFTSNPEMRRLIEQRKQAQLKIRAAFAKKFRKKTIQEYERALEQIKQQQQKLMPELKAAGEKILRRAENAKGGTQDAETTGTD